MNGRVSKRLRRLAGHCPKDVPSFDKINLRVKAKVRINQDGSTKEVRHSTFTLVRTDNKKDYSLYKKAYYFLKQKGEKYV